MTDPTEQHHFYVDLAPWWPLISPAQDYEEEASFAAKILDTASIPVREVLELGSGGGHNAVHLKAKFALTLVDLSAQMIAQSQLLNPECEHHVGDMRTVRLGREFDAVFVHDAVDYMTTEGDLRQAIQTAFAHCRPGGVAVFVPDDTAETFEPGTDHGGSDGPDGKAVRFLEWTWDPDPNDTWVATEYAFLLREGPDQIRLVHETHHTGLFAREVWLRLLAEAGFWPQTMVEETTEERSPRDIFIAHRPSRQ
jgi:SAM-dependent methyltransferase